MTDPVAERIAAHHELGRRLARAADDHDGSACERILAESSRLQRASPHLRFDFEPDHDYRIETVASEPFDQSIFDRAADPWLAIRAAALTWQSSKARTVIGRFIDYPEISPQSRALFGRRLRFLMPECALAILADVDVLAVEELVPGR